MMVRHFFLKDWEDSITGVVLLENSEWVLIADIPADFVIDGYQLIQKKELYDHYRDEESELKELVLQLKGTQLEAPKGFELDRIENMLQFIDQNLGYFGVQDEEEIIHVGKIHSIVANELRINHTDPFGYPDPSNTMPIFLSDIQTIQFGSDYMKSIKLLVAYREQTS